MSEEEKKNLEHIKKRAKYIKKNILGTNIFTTYDAYCLNILIKILEKQQKEIENLKEVNKEHQKLNRELRDEIKRQGNTREIEEKYIEENFISKDKIRDKIKDLEDNMILFTNDKEKFNRYKYERDILEKLLEEE